MKCTFLLLTALLISACSPGDTTGPKEAAQADNSLMQVISGKVTYRERILLPPGAEVSVVLEDQSRMDVAATLIARFDHTVDGAPPYPFRLVYDPKIIDTRMRYGLRARIEHNGELLFTTTQHIDPFATPPGEEITVMVQSARRD